MSDDRRLSVASDRRQNPVPDRRESARDDRRRGIDRRWAGRARTAALAVGTWLALRLFVVQAFDIPSGSMEGTLMTGDVMFVSKAGFGAEIPLLHKHLPAFRQPRQGEILVFRSVEGRFDMVKRLVGMPGDTVAMANGHLYRNYERVSESYAVHADSMRSENAATRRMMRAWQLSHYVGGHPRSYAPDVQHWGPLVVPAGSYFMMGDNRDDSRDSRYWGFLPRANVVGSPLVVYYSYDPSSWRALPLLTAIRWDRIFSRPE